MITTDDLQDTISEQGEQNNTRKKGRPKNSKNKQKTLADLVTYRDVQRAISVMRQALIDEKSTITVKFNAAKFLLAAKLDGIALSQKQKSLNLRLTQAERAKQQQQANNKQPQHSITTVYKTAAPPKPNDNDNFVSVDKPSVASVLFTDHVTDDE